MRIADFVPPTGIVTLRSRDAEGAVRELGDLLARVSDLPPERLIPLLLHRERVCTTAVGHEVAIPHARLAEAAATVGVLGKSQDGIDFHAPDGRLVHLFVAVVSPIHGGRHLHCFAAISRELADPGLRQKLLACTDGAETLSLLG